MDKIKSILLGCTLHMDSQMLREIQASFFVNHFRLASVFSILIIVLNIGLKLSCRLSAASDNFQCIEKNQNNLLPHLTRNQVRFDAHLHKSKHRHCIFYSRLLLLRSKNSKKQEIETKLDKQKLATSLKKGHMKQVLQTIIMEGRDMVI